MIGRRRFMAMAGGTAVSSLAPRLVRAEGGAVSAPVAETRYGKLRGTAQGDGIHVFKGVPYGASTAGANRFRRPQAPAAWPGVREATAFPLMSPQIVSNPLPLLRSWNYESETSEDCLALNVWSPGLRDGAKRPVMVWFHGGDYSSLSGSRNVFDGSRLARKGDVVVVTLNHRLNLFGFLYLSGIAPTFGEANVGMLDLVAALRWVRDNIAEFGGDPENVTIFGQSGGGGKVATMMAMPEGRGLFHRAIMQSASYARNAHLEALDREHATKHAHALLAALDIAPADAEKRLFELSADALVAGMTKALRSSSRPVFRPVADGAVLPAGPWWPQGPAVSAAVPIIVGSIEAEMSLIMGIRDPTLFELDESEMRKRLSWVRPERLNDVISVFRATRDGATPSQLQFSIATANVFRRGLWTQAEIKAAQNGAAGYLYEIDWTTPVDGGKWQGPHSMDLPFVFDNVAVSASLFGTAMPEAQGLADQMSSAWLAFARTGNPNSKDIPDWRPFTTERRSTMMFDLASKCADHFRDDERRVLEGETTRGILD